MSRLVEGSEMCVLCSQSLLVETHWTDQRQAAGEPAMVATAGSDRERQRRRDWQHRAQILNRILGCYGLSLDNWQNRHYVLSDRKGRSEMVTDLGALWPAAAQLLGRPLDPLDPQLMEALSGENLAREGGP